MTMFDLEPPDQIGGRPDRCATQTSMKALEACLDPMPIFGIVLNVE